MIETSKSAGFVGVAANTSESKDKTLELSVVIVNYNVKEFLEQTLVSVTKALDTIPSNIIVVDNASVDGSQQLIRERFPDVTLVANPENAGFAKASNQGIRMSQARFVALLNPDTIVEESTFSRMLEFFHDNPRAGMAGCKILNPDGTLQLACRRSFPTPWVAFTKLSGLSFLFAKSKMFGRYNLTYLDPDETHAVDAISGSFMMVRSSTLEQVGLLDESFFLYGEDLDWCYRMGKNGWDVMYFPGTQIIHFKGESSKKARFDNLRTFYHSMDLFARKHFKKNYYRVPYRLLWAGIWLRAGLSLLWNLVTHSAAAVADFVLLSVSLVMGVFLRFGSMSELPAFKVVIPAYSLIWLLTLFVSGSYDRRKYSFWTAASAITFGFFINASLTFFFKQYAFSRAVVLYSFVLALLLVSGWRVLVKLLPRFGNGRFKGTLGRTLLARSTLIVGDLESGGRLIKKLNSKVDSGYDIAGLVSLNGENAGELINGVYVLGGLDRLNTIIRESHAQEVIFSTHGLTYDQILRIIASSNSQRVNFKLIPTNMEVIIGKASIDRIDDMPLLEIDYKLHRRGYRFVKRLFDVAVAGAYIGATFPIYVVKKYVFRAVLEDRFFFRDGREVTLQAFTSGRSNFWDKLPYLVAVLQGHLSLVGSEINWDKLASTENSVELKPGLTGIVQVNRAKELSDDDKQKYQIYYLKNYSPLLDIEILVRAIFKV